MRLMSRRRRGRCGKNLGGLDAIQIRDEAGSIVAQPLYQRARQQLRLRIRNDLQASGPDLMAHRPGAGRVCRRGPDNITRTTHYPAAEAPAEFDTSELATELTAASTHDGNSRNAASTSRLGPLASRYRREQVASCWTAQSPIRIVGDRTALSALRRSANSN
jgi:hypothetical protein